MQCDPVGVAAAHELLQMVCQYYATKYPTLFSLTSEGHFENGLTHKSYELLDSALDPLQTLNEISPNDFAIMLEESCRWTVQVTRWCSLLGAGLVTEYKNRQEP